jgi:4-carboxymuconolactone decarboxylase
MNDGTPTSPRTPRIPLIPPDRWTAEQDAAYAVMDSSATKRLGASAHLTTAMANHPRLAAAFYTLGRHILLDSTLSDRLRELVTLRVGWRHKSGYEWYHHVRSGKRIGLTDAEIDAVKQGADAALWSPADACVLRVADQLMATSRIDDALWAEVTRHLDQQMAMDLVFTVGHYVLTAWATAAFGIEVEPGFETPEHPLE